MNWVSASTVFSMHHWRRLQGSFGSCAARLGLLGLVLVHLAFLHVQLHFFGVQCLACWISLVCATEFLQFDCMVFLKPFMHRGIVGFWVFCFAFFIVLFPCCLDVIWTQLIVSAFGERSFCCRHECSVLHPWTFIHQWHALLALLLLFE